MKYDEALTKIINDHGLSILDNAFYAYSILADLIRSSIYDKRLNNLLFNLLSNFRTHQLFINYGLDGGRCEATKIYQSLNNVSKEDFINTINPISKIICPDEYEEYLLKKQSIVKKVDQFKDVESLPLLDDEDTKVKPKVKPKPIVNPINNPTPQIRTCPISNNGIKDIIISGRNINLVIETSKDNMFHLFRENKEIKNKQNIFARNETIFIKIRNKEELGYYATLYTLKMPIGDYRQLMIRGKEVSVRLYDATSFIFESININTINSNNINNYVSATAKNYHIKCSSLKLICLTNKFKKINVEADCGDGYCNIYVDDKIKPNPTPIFCKPTLLFTDCMVKNTEIHFGIRAYGGIKVKNFMSIFCQF